MKQLITEFPNNITEAIKIAANSNFSQPKNEIRNVVICGMGGSGIGGSIVSKWLEDELSIPIYVSKDYSLPNFVNENSLVIGSSYSGDTEETLSSVELAIKKGAHIIGITSGGKMQRICNENGFDVVIVPGGNPPRTALAYSLVQLINIFKCLGLIVPGRLKEMESGRDLIINEGETIHKEAMSLAQFLKGKVGIFYGTSEYESVLIRARQQFNENSKLLCWQHAIPEMNHNELVGWGGGDDRFAVVFFDNDNIHPRNAKRIEITKAKIQAITDQVHSISSKGNTIIEKSLYLINLVDWASYYLSELKPVDAMDIKVIDYLKSELAKF